MRPAGRQQYNTFEALKHYQQAFDAASKQGIVRFSMDDDFSHSRSYVPEDVVPKAIRLKLADCHYKRANYRQCAELLKNMPEDSLSHDAFRQLVYSYKHQGDNGAYMYWAGQESKPTQQLTDMIRQAERMVAYYKNQK